MKKHLIFLLFLLVVTNLSGQETQIDTAATWVIANGGLNLRSKPSAYSAKLLTIPFGSTVKYISDQSFNIDSITLHYDEPQKRAEVIKGSWVKVEYKRIKGYVLNTYLTPKNHKTERFDEQHGEDFVLLYPGCGCAAQNIHDPGAWKWFGFFKKEKGVYEAEEIKINYYKTNIYTCDLIIYASKNKNLSFIIGSRYKNLSGSKKAKEENFTFKISHPIDQGIKSRLDNISIEILKRKDYNKQVISDLYIKKDNLKQLLNKPEYDYPYEIKFVGDLDGDARDDYIIHYGDKSGIILLYLSSKAKAGNLLEKAGIFFAPYCC